MKKGKMNRRKLMYIFLSLWFIIAISVHLWLQIPRLGGAIDIYAKQVMANPQEYGLPGQPIYNYAVYNLIQPSKDCYECTLMINLAQDTEERLASDYPAALQDIRITKKGLGWQAQPQSDFQRIILRAIMLPRMLPLQTYAADWGDFHIAVYQQTEWCYYNIYGDSLSQPQPKAETDFYIRQEIVLTYTGAPEDTAQYKSLGIACAPMNDGEERPQLERPISYNDSSGSSNSGGTWCNRIMQGNWRNEIFMGGGGTNLPKNNLFYVIDSYALDFYINGEKAAELTLLPVED